MSDEGKHSRTVANAGPPTGLAYIYSPQSRHARCCLRGLVPVCARLPVLVLAMGTALAHMLRADAGTTADAPDHGTEGPAGPRFLAWSAADQAEVVQDQTAPQAPLAGSGPSAQTRPAQQQAHDARAATASGSGISQARVAASRLTAAGKPVSRRACAARESGALTMR